MQHSTIELYQRINKHISLAQRQIRPHYLYNSIMENKQFHFSLPIYGFNQADLR